MATNSTPIGNVAAGYLSLYTSTGADNTAIGMSALSYNQTGAYNIALGEVALYSIGSGNNNTGVGAYLLCNQTGSGKSLNKK